MARLLDQLGNKPRESIPGALGGWADIQGAYRFFDHERVTMEKILEPHSAATIERLRGHPVILAIQDTTFVNYSGCRATTDLGPHSSDREHGLLLHPLLAVTPDRQCLGVLSAVSWARDAALNKTARRKTAPIEEKESMRWLNGYEHCAALHEHLPGTTLVCVADREADIYELFANARPEQAHWLVRATHDRCTEDGPHMRQRLASQPLLGTRTIAVPATKTQAARMAVIEIRTDRFHLTAPRRPDRQLPEIEVTAILAHEPNPPVGCPGVDWLLLTSLAQPQSCADACTILDWYACRWQIEVFFHVLKSGCTIEHLQLQTRRRLEAAIAIYLVIAWRILFTMTTSRACPDLPATVVFTPDECAAAHILSKRTMGDEPPRLAAVVRLVAALGGYINKPSQGPPGPKTLWIGWQRLRDVVWGMTVARAQATKGRCVES